MTKKMSPGTMSRNRCLARSRRRRCLCQGVRSIVTGAAVAVPKMSDSDYRIALRTRPSGGGVGTDGR
jgi:hypothetical protein